MDAIDFLEFFELYIFLSYSQIILVLSSYAKHEHIYLEVEKGYFNKLEMIKKIL